MADTSAVADPNTGVSVYDTYQQSGWLVFGGTSVSSPMIAAVYGLAGNASSINTGYLYSHVTGNFHDVKSGSNGSCGGSYLCTGVKGYDGPTGLGTPKGTGGFYTTKRGAPLNQGLLWGTSSRDGKRDSYRTTSFCNSFPFYVTAVIALRCRRGRCNCLTSTLGANSRGIGSPLRGCGRGTALARPHTCATTFAVSLRRYNELDCPNSMRTILT